MEITLSDDESAREALKEPGSEDGKAESRPRKFTLQATDNTVENVLDNLMVLSGLHWTHVDGVINVYQNRSDLLTHRIYITEPLIVRSSLVDPDDYSDDGLVHLIRTSIAPEWRHQERVAMEAIHGVREQDRHVSSKILVKAEAAVQHEVEALLNSLLEFRDIVDSGGIVEKPVFLGNRWRDDITDALARNIQLPKSQLSITECINILRKALAINVMIDAKALPTLSSQVVSLSQSSMSAKAILEHICHEGGGVYGVHNKVIVITTETSPSVPIGETAMYDVRDLVSEFGHIGFVTELLQRIIPGKWDGEYDSIEEWNETLILTHNAKIHDAVQALFKRLRSGFKK